MTPPESTFGHRAKAVNLAYIMVQSENFSQTFSSIIANVVGLIFGIGIGIFFQGDNSSNFDINARKVIYYYPPGD